MTSFERNSSRNSYATARKSQSAEIQKLRMATVSEVKKPMDKEVARAHRANRLMSLWPA